MSWGDVLTCEHDWVDRGTKGDGGLRWHCSICEAILCVDFAATEDHSVEVIVAVSGDGGTKWLRLSNGR